MLCTPPQESILVRSITSAYGQRCSRTSYKIEPVQNLWASSTFLGSKTTQPLETYSRSEQAKPFGGHQDHPPIRGVGYLNRCLLPHINTGTVQEISEISCPGSDIPVQISAFRSVYSTDGIHCSNKGVETDGHTQGYKDPPIPRRLVDESQIPPGLSPPHSRSSENMPRTRLAVEFRKIRSGTKAGLRLCRLPVRLQGRSGPTYTGHLAEPAGQNTRNTVTTDLSGLAV